MGFVGEMIKKGSIIRNHYNLQMFDRSTLIDIIPISAKVPRMKEVVGSYFLVKRSSDDLTEGEFSIN